MMSTDTTSYPSSANTLPTLPVPLNKSSIRGCRPVCVPFGAFRPLTPGVGSGPSGPSPPVPGVPSPRHRGKSTTLYARTCQRPDAHHHQYATPTYPTVSRHIFSRPAGTCESLYQHTGDASLHVPVTVPTGRPTPAPRKSQCIGTPAVLRLLLATKFKGGSTREPPWGTIFGPTRFPQPRRRFHTARRPLTQNNPPLVATSTAE